MAGITAAGLEIKRLDQIIEDITSRARTPEYFGPALAADDDTPMGHLIKLISVSIYEVWQLIQQDYDSRDPYGADGVSLDNACLLVGVERNGATKTTVLCEMDGTPGTVIPAGSLVRIGFNGPEFETVEELTLTAGTDTVYVEATEYGPIEAPAGSIDTIVTVIAGWDTVTNPEDASPGRDVESDEDLRIRRESSLQITGASTDYAIKAKVEQLVDVEAANVISNRTLVTDAYGIPGKAFMVVVWPDPLPDPSLLVEAIWSVQPAGILAYGDENYTVTDEFGYSQPVSFSYAQVVNIWVNVELTYKTSFYDGDDAVIDAVEEYGEKLSVGDDVRGLAITLAITGCSGEPNVRGIVSLIIKLSKTGFPGSIVDIPIDLTEIADIDRTRISVNSLPAV